MVAKLKAYRLANGYREGFSLPILQGLTGNFSNPDYVSFGSYTDAQIGQLDSDYGILYREFQALNQNNQTTKAKVIEIQYADNRFLVTGWSNGNPFIANSLVMYRYNPVSPILANKDEVIDVSDLLYEDDVEIVRQIESLDKFDLRVSRATFRLDNSDALTSFMNKYWNPDGYLQAEYMIGVELEGYFWGFSDFDNINYDEVEQTYYFDAYDPIKWLQKNIWSQRIPSLGLGTANVENFLLKTCPLFFTEGKTVNVDVYATQIWNRDYTGGYYGDYNPYYYTLDEHLTIIDMMGEIMKHYGAIIFYDANGDLNFVRRDKSNSTDYSEDDMLEDLNKSFQAKEYSGLLINVSESGSNWSYSGWALIWEENGELQDIAVNANLNNIPKNFNYLDLRQELPDTTFEYRVFAVRTKEEIYQDYKELLKSLTLYETTLNGIDYQLYDTLFINGVSYTINYLQISTNADVTKVRVYKTL